MLKFVTDIGACVIGEPWFIDLVNFVFIVLDGKLKLGEPDLINTKFT